MTAMQNRTAEAALRKLVTEIEIYISSLKGPGIASVLEGLGKWARGPIGQIKPRSIPACEHLDPALLAMGKPSLAKAIADARPFLHWVSYDAYPREDIGAGFADNHAFASIIGEGCPIERWILISASSSSPPVFSTATITMQPRSSTRRSLAPTAGASSRVIRWSGKKPTFQSGTTLGNPTPP